MCIVLRSSLLLSCALACSGCTELVVLGRDCRGEAPCLVEVDGRVTPNDMDASSHPDGAEPNLDASRPRLDGSHDAAVDANVPAPGDAAFWKLPALLNPSFELTGGEAGDVATLSLPTGTMISPWNSCLPIGVDQSLLAGVRAETLLTYSDRGNSVRVFPQHERTFIAMKYFVAVIPPVLQQQLRTPMLAGEHYGFAIDVRSSNPAANLSLQVYGGAQACSSLISAATLLAATDPITGPDWQTVCLRFTAPVELPYLIFMEDAPLVLNGDLLFIDNLRSVEACPR